MNLLPPGEKEEVGKERLRRLAVIAGVFLGGLTWLGVILMLPSFFFLEFEKNELARGLGALEDSPEIQKVKAIEETARALDLKLAALERAEGEAQHPMGLFRNVLASRPEGVQISDISYASGAAASGGRLTLAGRAKTRKDLFTFSDRLQNTADFKKVSSPVSNFLKERDLDFSLLIELKQK